MFASPFGWRFDGLSFFIGLCSGIFLTILIGFLVYRFQAILTWFNQQYQRVSLLLNSSAAQAYRSELIDRLQSSHIANPLFPFHEIIIPPRLLLPKQPIDPQQEETPIEILPTILPNLPDFTHLSSVYNPSTIGLEEIVPDQISLMITGNPGCGKTSALVYLALRELQPSKRERATQSRIPLLIHASDLQIPENVPSDLLHPILNASQSSAPATLAPRLPGYLRTLFQQEQVLFLLDGLDELNLQEQTSIFRWLKEIHHSYPSIQIIATGPPYGYDGAVKAGLVPIPLAPWTASDRYHFFERWFRAWRTYVQPLLPTNRPTEVDPALIHGWLEATTSSLSPLDITLKLWAAYVGDVRGPSYVQGFQALMDRLLSGEERKQLQRIAELWLKGGESSILERQLPSGSMVSEFVQAGLLTRRSGMRLSFSHMLIGCYLAAQAMKSPPSKASLKLPEWLPAQEALHFLVAQGSEQGSSIVPAILETNTPPTEHVALTCSRWLINIPAEAPCRSPILRPLATILQAENKPFGLRLRALHALTAAKEDAAMMLFHRLFTSQDATSRVLGAFGLGASYQTDSVKSLLDSIKEDQSTEVRQACCFALAAIGTEPALNGLGQALLSEDEPIRLSAAAALANHREGGHPMLQEAMTLDDLLVRRAAIYGITRIEEPWAQSVLEKARTEDDQWIVRSAAVQALERKDGLLDRIPSLPIELSELPWLIAYAAERGMGVAPGAGAWETLRQVFNDGTNEEKIAALEIIAWLESDAFQMEISQSLQSPEPLLRDAAFETLWRLAAGGMDVSTFAPVKAKNSSEQQSPIPKAD